MGASIYYYYNIMGASIATIIAHSLGLLLGASLSEPQVKDSVSYANNVQPFK